MTKEELKQEAEEKYHNHKIVDFQGFYNHHYYYLGYVESAEPREKRIAELEAQIEKMKCCANCQTVRDAEGNCYLEKDGKCKNKDKWELRR